MRAAALSDDLLFHETVLDRGVDDLPPTHIAFAGNADLEAAVARFGGTGEQAPDVDELIAIDADVRAAFASGTVGAST